MAKDYTTKTAVENYLLIDIDASFDEQIIEWQEVVEQYIDHATSRDFSVAGETATDRVYDGDGTDTLVIDPAKEVVSVKMSATSDALATTQYVLYPANKTVKNKIKLLHQDFHKGNQNIVVNAKFGYEEVPKDIRFVATVLLAGIINTQWQSEGEVQSMTIGRYQVTYKSDQQISDFNKVEEILDYNKKYTF